jgi:hypothetical protein
MKIRVTIEYDPDWPTIQEGETLEGWLEQERKDWVEGNISVADLDGHDAIIKLKVIS